MADDGAFLALATTAAADVDNQYQFERGRLPFLERSAGGLINGNSHLRRRERSGNRCPGNTQSLRHSSNANATTTKRWFSL